MAPSLAPRVAYGPQTTTGGRGLWTASLFRSALGRRPTRSVSAGLCRWVALSVSSKPMPPASSCCC